VGSGRDDIGDVGSGADASGAVPDGEYGLCAGWTVPGTGSGPWQLGIIMAAVALLVRRRRLV